MMNTNIKTNWQSHRLGDICNIIGGGTPSKSIHKYYAGNICWATVRDMKNDVISDTEFKITPEAIKNSAANIIPENNVIIATRVGLGKICLLKNDTAINQDLKGIIPKNKKIISVPYLFHWFKNIADTIVENGKGATVQGVTLNFIKDLEIPLPPIREQKRIVAVLDEEFAAVGKAKENAEKNLANARELFESYLQNVFANSSDRWGKRKLGDLCNKITKGSSPNWQGIKYVDSPGVLFITSENVGENEIILKNRKYVEEHFNVSDKKSILQKGDVLTNIVGASIGRTAIFTLDEIANINQAVCILRCNPRLLLNRYLAHSLNSPFFKKVLHDNEINNARANLSLGFFSNLSITVPSIPEQKRIVAEIDKLSSEINKLKSIYQQKLSDLEELKKSILQKAFQGELT